MAGVTTYYDAVHEKKRKLKKSWSNGYSFRSSCYWLYVLTGRPRVSKLPQEFPISPTVISRLGTDRHPRQQQQKTESAPKLIAIFWGFSESEHAPRFRLTPDLYSDYLRNLPLKIVPKSRPICFRTLLPESFPNPLVRINLYFSSDTPPISPPSHVSEQCSSD